MNATPRNLLMTGQPRELLEREVVVHQSGKPGPTRAHRPHLLAFVLMDDEAMLITAAGEVHIHEPLVCRTRWAPMRSTSEGCVSPLHHDVDMASWDALLDDFGWTIGSLGTREFLVVEYRVGLDPDPYAQVARESDGSWYCELVSRHHLPREVWPIDEVTLANCGWDPPVGMQTNWSLESESPQEAAHLLLEGLRLGRACLEPQRIVGRLGRWPSDPDDPAPDPVMPGGPFDLAA